MHRHAYCLLRQDVHISLYFTHEIYSRLCCVVCKVGTDTSYPACTSAGTNTPTNRLANALSYFAPNFLCMGLECYFNLFSHIRSHLGKDFFPKEKFEKECPKWTDKYAVYRILAKIFSSSYFVPNNVPEGWDNEMKRWNVSDFKNCIAWVLGRHTENIVSL